MVSQAISREACDAVTGARQDDAIQKGPPNRSSGLPVPPTARLRRHYRTPALHLFLPTFFPACPSDAVEVRWAPQARSGATRNDGGLGQIPSAGSKDVGTCDSRTSDQGVTDGSGRFRCAPVRPPQP